METGADVLSSAELNKLQQEGKQLKVRYRSFQYSLQKNCVHMQTFIKFIWIIAPTLCEFSERTYILTYFLQNYKINDAQFLNKLDRQLNIKRWPSGIVELKYILIIIMCRCVMTTCLRVPTSWWSASCPRTRSSSSSTPRSRPSGIQKTWKKFYSLQNPYWKIPAVEKKNYFLSFKWNGSLYIYPRSTHWLAQSLTD